jgi:purine-binding chemotaxis protein CheW
MAAREKYATFYLAGIYFGIPAIAVQEVLEYQRVIPVPLAPAALPGIINLRGQILPVLALRERLQLASSEARSLEDSRMAVVRTQDGLLTLLIDRVGEILDVDSDTFEPPAETLKRGVRAVTSHICKLDGQLLLILDLVKLCELPETKAAAQTQSETNAAQTVTT